MFFIILVTTAAPHFFCTLTSINSISEPNNPVCVLGTINERYEVLCNVRMFVSLCQKLNVNYGQTIAVFVLFHETEWVYDVLRILNLEGQQNCMIGSKVTTILSPFFFKKLKTSNIGMWGVYPEAIDWNIALLTWISFCVSESKEKHFQSLKTYKMAPFI